MPRAATAFTGLSSSSPDSALGVREPSPKEIRAQLERMLASRCFQRGVRASRFLRFAVEETLAGQAKRLKGYSIAVEVFDRPTSFDAQSDPLVRVEAGRLRRRVLEYNTTEGSDDPVRIEFRPGSYAAHFSYADRGGSPQPERARDQPTAADDAGPRRWRRIRTSLIASVLLAALSVIVVQQVQLSRVAADARSSIGTGTAKRLEDPLTPVASVVSKHPGVSGKPSMTNELDEMRRNAAEVSDFLRSLSNENRLLVLCLLLEGEQSVSQLNAQVHLSASALSQHLSWLREGGLVKTRREAQTIYYSLADDRVTEVLAVLKRLFC